MCTGAHTSLYCPVLEHNYFSQGYATSEILSHLSLLYTLDAIYLYMHAHAVYKLTNIGFQTWPRILAIDFGGSATTCTRKLISEMQLDCRQGER